MIGHLRLIAAIVRKDLTVLWPLAAIVVLSPVLRTDAVLQTLHNDNLRAAALVVFALAAGLLIIGVMHQDASASLRHDWLTRPIPRGTLLIAKLAFVGATVYLPASATAFASTLADGGSSAEAFARATSINYGALAAILTVALFAAVTSTLLQAAGALIAVVVLVLLAQAVSGSILPDAKGTLAAGAEWLSFAPAVYLPILLAVPVLWLQYGRRRTSLARAIVGGVCIGAIVPVLTPPATMFSVLRLFQPAADAAGAADLTLAPGCFLLIATDTESGVVPNDAQRLWDGDQRAKAGPRALAFSTTVAPTAPRRGWKTMIGYAEAAYVAADGRILHRLQGASNAFGRPEQVDASVAATHSWLASRDAYEDAARNSARLRLTYFVSLLEPVASAEIDVDDGRRYLTGFGHCRIARGPSPDAVSIDCFARGSQPALLTAAWSGVMDARETLKGPSYMPAALEVLSGMPSRLTLSRVPGSTAHRARLTAYEDRAHVEVAVDAAGLLGGPSCPAPPASPRTVKGEQG